MALLAQTTLSHRDWHDVLEATQERFPDMWMPGRSDLCFATTNRQSALMEIAPRCDAVVVIGSANSSNTRALESLARDAGLPPGATGSTAPRSCPTTCSGTVGVTAGASAPEELVEAVIARLAPRHGVEEVSITDEDEYFPPPRNLRDLLIAIDVGASFALGGPDQRPAARSTTGRSGPATCSPPWDDRRTCRSGAPPHDVTMTPAVRAGRRERHPPCATCC